MRPRLSRLRGGSFFAGEAMGNTIEKDIDHRRGVQREDLAKEQPADHRDSQRASNSEPSPVPNASGSPPSSAAMVVIMMGRKRNKTGFIYGFG